MRERRNDRSNWFLPFLYLILIVIIFLLCFTSYLSSQFSCVTQGPVLEYTLHLHTPLSARYPILPYLILPKLSTFSPFQSYKFLSLSSLHIFLSLYLSLFLFLSLFLSLSLSLFFLSLSLSLSHSLSLSLSVSLFFRICLFFFFSL